MSKKQDQTKQIVSQEEISRRIAETSGMMPDEICKLLESLANIERSRKIVQRKSSDKKSLLGRIFPEKKHNVLAALEHAQDRLEARIKKENELRKKQIEIPPRHVLNDEEYPKRLSPQDIRHAIDGARTYLGNIETKEAKDPVSERKADLILRIIQNLKKHETTRVARQIALKQQYLYEAYMRANQGEYKPPEYIKKTPEEIEEELMKAERQLVGFGEGLRTLIDDAADVVNDDFDAAANVVRQWVGTQHKAE